MRKDITLDLAKFKVGDYVEKHKGEALWYGWIVSVYHTRRGRLRYVVEIDSQGFQMIAVEGQLIAAKERRLGV